MKIVTLSTKDTFGGAAKIAYRLHKSLQSEGVDELMIVNSKRSKDDSKIISVSSLHDRKGFIKSSIDNLLRKRKELNRIKKWDIYLSTRLDKVYTDLEISLLGNSLEKVPFDILQLHWVGENFVNFTEFTGVKQPVVWTLHDCAAFTGICTYYETCEKYKTHCGDCPFLGSKKEQDFSYEIFEQKLERYKNIDFHIVCPSSWLANSVKESKLLGHYPIHVIPNGIDTNSFLAIPKEQAKTSLGLDITKKHILFGGIAIGKDERKGGHLLLEALNELKKSTNNSIELLILGVDSLNIDLPFKTHFLGYVDNEVFMRIIYSAADLTVVPSMYENLPTVILESMSCETSVTAFNIGGNSDMIDHGVNGYLAKPYDTTDFCEGIKFCLENNTNNKLGIEARKKIMKGFKIEDTVKQYIELYQQVLSK